MKLKKGDTIQVVKGKDKGKSGVIERIYAEIDKVLVSDINQFKRHVKARYPGQVSEIKTISKPLPVSNVALICTACHKMTRIGYAMRNDIKVRICKKCEETL